VLARGEQLEDPPADGIGQDVERLHCSPMFTP
jgi:hypothetical protein